MDPIAPIAQTPVPQAPVSVPAPQITPAGSFDGPVALTKFAWGIFIKHWKTLGLILLVPVVIYAIGVLLIATHSSIGSILGFIVVVAFYVFLLAALPATIRAIHHFVTGAAPVSVATHYRFGFSVFWPFLLVTIIAGLVMAGSSALLVIPGIFVAVSTLVYKYAFVIDGKRGFSALTESFALVRGRWWKVFGRMLFLILVVVIVYIIVILIGLLVSMLPPVLAVVIGIIIGLAFLLFAWSFGHAYFYRLYNSLKESRSANVPTGTFKGWLIAFLCIGIISPLILIPIMSAIVLSSLNVARMKGIEAQQNAQARMAEIQRVIDAENLKSMQQGTGTPVQK